jgi:hypothetical protein
VKIDLKQELALGQLTLTMTENCHGDSQPLLDNVQFNRLHEKLAPDTGALAGAMIASRWCGEVLEFSGFKISADIADAVRLIVPDAKFVQPVDGFRRNLCEGHLRLLVSKPEEAASVVESSHWNDGLTRLVTWSGEFVRPATRSSSGRIAGEVSTNADVFLPTWETSVCLGLLVGGLKLGSIVIKQPESEYADDVERIAAALRIAGVQLRIAQASESKRGENLYRRVAADEEERKPIAREDQRRPAKPALAFIGRNRGRR